MPAFYNENEPHAAAWLRELIKAGHIAPGEVDERSIEDVRPEDLVGFEQCHFFAGIGGWSYALRLAGWPDDRPVWTGSCPCQPFSIAGKRLTTSDHRHLWPAFRRLIRQRSPAIIFGEQVASADGRGWLARVRVDLEDGDYAFGSANLCAAGEAAPHLRQRYYFVAYAHSQRCDWQHPLLRTETGGRLSCKTLKAARHGCLGPAVDDADGTKWHWWHGPLQVGWNAIQGEVERGGRKYRAQWRIKPSLPLVADGIPGRVHLCRGFGNAIVPQVAATFIQASVEAINTERIAS